MFARRPAQPERSPSPLPLRPELTYPDTASGAAHSVRRAILVDLRLECVVVAAGRQLEGRHVDTPAMGVAGVPVTQNSVPLTGWLVVRSNTRAQTLPRAL
jgi:hypothetical protein